MSSEKRKIESDNEQSDEEEHDFSGEEVNVDFDFQDPVEVDFHALKNLLRNLFDSDADNFALSHLTDMILDIKKHYGTTIKIENDANGGDPYAFFSVLDLSANKASPEIKAIINYYIQKTGKNPEFTRKLRQILSSSAAEKVGLILSERFINMPVELAPPLWSLYNDHVAESGGKEYDYYLIVSKTYTEEESEIDKEDNRPTKRSKFSNPKETFHFHVEDAVIHDTCLYNMSFPYTKEVLSDSKRAFNKAGIQSTGHVMLMAGDKLGETVKNLQEKFSA